MKSSRSKRPARKKDAGATREAILVAAREAFTRLGYDGAGVREIAAAAGANPALVNRYFGSKEALFEEAVPTAFEIAPLLPEARQGFAEALARYVLTKDKAALGGFDATLAMLRSVGNPKATELMREGLEERFVAPLADWIGEPDADVRAALFMALLSGVAVMRDVMGVAPLRGDVERTVRWLTPLLDALVAPSGKTGGST